MDLIQLVPLLPSTEYIPAQGTQVILKALLSLWRKPAFHRLPQALLKYLQELNNLSRRAHLAVIIKSDERFPNWPHFVPPALPSGRKRTTSCSAAQGQCCQAHSDTIYKFFMYE